MAIPFLNNINLSDNELQNAKLHVTSTVPAAEAGQIYFNSTQNVARYHNGTTWVDIPRKISVGGTELAYSQAIDLAAGTNVGIAESQGVITISSTDEFEGTVTSVSASTTGDALDVAVTNTTTTPGLGFTWAGSASQYVDGQGNLQTFPTYEWKIEGDTGGPTAVASGDTIDFEGGTNVTTSFSGTTLTINATDTNDNDYLTALSFNTADGILTATVQNQANVTVDLDNRYLTENQAITLSGDVTGSGTTSIVTTIAAGAVDFSMLNPTDVITEAEGIENNDNDITIPTSAAVKAYADSLIVGGLIYQGGFDGSTGVVTGTSNYLDSRGTQIAVNKGWTYTVTTAGTFYGEVVEVGDVLIAEDDLASGTGALTDWTTVQNNVDLASLTQIGIGNVNAGTGIDVAYSGGTATVSLTAVAARSGSIAVPTSATYTYPNSITAGATNNVLIQLVDSGTGETVYADVTRISETTFSVDYGVAEPTGVIALIQLIG